MQTTGIEYGNRTPSTVTPSIGRYNVGGGIDHPDASSSFPNSARTSFRFEVPELNDTPYHNNHISKGVGRRMPEDFQELMRRYETSNEEVNSLAEFSSPSASQHQSNQNQKDAAPLSRFMTPRMQTPSNDNNDMNNSDVVEPRTPGTYSKSTAAFKAVFDNLSISNSGESVSGRSFAQIRVDKSAESLKMLNSTSSLVPVSANKDLLLVSLGAGKLPDVQQEQQQPQQEQEVKDTFSVNLVGGGEGGENVKELKSSLSKIETQVLHLTDRVNRVIGQEEEEDEAAKKIQAAWRERKARSQSGDYSHEDRIRLLEGRLEEEIAARKSLETKVYELKSKVSFPSSSSSSSYQHAFMYS
jgi:hypothetical protein